MKVQLNVNRPSSTRGWAMIHLLIFLGLGVAGFGMHATPPTPSIPIWLQNTEYFQQVGLSWALTIDPCNRCVMTLRMICCRSCKQKWLGWLFILPSDWHGGQYLFRLILRVHLNRQNKDWLADTRKQKRATITKGEFSWWESHWVSIHHKIKMNGFPIHVPSSPPPSPFGTERPIIFHIASRRLHHLPSFALKLRAKKSVLFANIPFWYYVQGHPTWFYTGNGIIL